MKSKSLTAYIAFAILMAVVIAVGVALLYRDSGSANVSRGREALASRNPVLVAVPSDAVAVLDFADFDEELKLLTDGTKLVGALAGVYEGSALTSFVEACKELCEGNSQLRNASAVVSLHYSGSLVPVFSVDIARCDTSTVRDLGRIAEESGLKSRTCGRFMVMSVSDALTLSAERHVANGVSILSNEGFVDCMAASSARNVMAFANDHASRLFSAYLGRSMSRMASFVKSYSTWTLLSLDECRPERLKMGIHACNNPLPQYYSEVLKGGKTGDIEFSSVAPSTTIWALSMSLQDRGGMTGRYVDYLDALSKLAAVKRERTSLSKSAGIAPDEWFNALDIRELVRLSWRPDASSEPCDAILFRIGVKTSTMLPQGDDIEEFSYSGFAANVLGGLFRLVDESCCTLLDGKWLVCGSRQALENLIMRRQEGDSLDALMSDASVGTMIPAKAVLAAYFSPSSCDMEKTFAAGIRKAVDATFDGAAFEPCVLVHDGVSMSLDVRRCAAFESVRTPALVADTQITIPSGPFEVTSADGGKYIIQQQSNYYLSYKESGGKGVWSIPFDAPLCGAVESIDYYNNGKIQYLFCAGSKLYLLDRLGRFVKDFPADMGKEVLLGPAVFDFTGAHGYTVMAVHKDNSVGMYNIHGKSKEDWQGIVCEDSIIALPELLESAGRRYWIVRTSREALIFGFNGGEPIQRETGGKSIRRDSSFEPTGKGSVKVICNDGKERNIKLNDK